MLNIYHHNRFQLELDNKITDESNFCHTSLSLIQSKSIALFVLHKSLDLSVNDAINFWRPCIPSGQVLAGKFPNLKVGLMLVILKSACLRLAVNDALTIPSESNAKEEDDASARSRMQCIKDVASRCLL